MANDMKTQQGRGSQGETAGNGGIFLDAEALKAMVQCLVEQTLELEVERHLGARPYERTAGRLGRRNGYKPRTMKTRVGELEFAVPQVREGGFQPTLFERFQRTEKALLMTLQEMFVKGVSTREVGEVLEKMGGFEVSPGLVSRAAAELDEEVKRWRERRLDLHEYPYLVIDARREKVRRNGRIVGVSVLVVTGINDDGEREVLGYWLGDSESEATWSEAFCDLKRRGLKGVSLVVSDAHSGIRKGLAQELPEAAWQRCRVHLMRELMNQASWRDRKELAQDLRGIYASEEKEQCLLAAGAVAAKWEKRLPRMSRALEAGVEDTLTVLAYPREHRRRLHSTNMVERLNREFRKRTRKVSIFPNDSSCLRLFGAMCLEVNDKWEGETRRYLNMERR